MGDADVLIVKGEEVRRVLGGRELEIIEIVRKAYESHARKARCHIPSFCVSPTMKETE